LKLNANLLQLASLEKAKAKYTDQGPKCVKGVSEAGRSKDPGMGGLGTEQIFVDLNQESNNVWKSRNWFHLMLGHRVEQCRAFHRSHLLVPIIVSNNVGKPFEYSKVV